MTKKQFKKYVIKHQLIGEPNPNSLISAATRSRDVILSGPITLEMRVFVEAIKEFARGNYS
jgi:hypothetical protein